MRFNISVVLLFVVLPFSLQAQYSVSSRQGVTGDMAEVRSAFMSANDVSFVMYNYGQYTRPNTLANLYDFVWHGLGSMDEFGPLLAANVVTQSNDTLHIIDDGMWLTSQGGYAPDGSMKWGWLPRAGYANPLSPNLATSTDTASWPSAWLSWPASAGSPGSLKEAFYVMDDFSNAEFPYYHFPSDSSKRGLGVSAEVRTYQYGGSLKDAVIFEWKLRNESPNDLDSCYFGFYGDLHIGGYTDYIDDRYGYLASEQTVYCWDNDWSGMGGLRPGVLNFRFLETPGSNGLTNFAALPYGNPNFPKNRDLMWSLLSSTDIMADPQIYESPGDNVLVFGTGPFSLASGDSTIVKLAIFFTSDTTALQLASAAVRLSSHWPAIAGSPGSFGGDSSLAISITSPDSGEVSGSVPVSWNYTGSEPGAKVFVEFSFDHGMSWKPLAYDLDPSLPFQWNTAETRDGVNYLLRVVAYSSDQSKFYYDITDHRFTVNNPVNAKPELSLDRSFEHTIANSTPLSIHWTAEDADDTTLTITLAYASSNVGPFTVFHTGPHSVGKGSFDWDLGSVPNIDSCLLRITASDGSLDSTLVSHAFTIRQQHGSYAASIFQHLAGKATPNLRLVVVEPLSITGHQYEMTFSVPTQDSVLMDVRDVNTNGIVVNQWLVQNGISTPLFDGLKLTVKDAVLDVDTLRSGFTRLELSGAVDYAYGGVPVQSKVPLDWFIVFHSLDTLADGSYSVPGDTLLNLYGARDVVAPFHIVNVEETEQTLGFAPQSTPGKRWKPDESLVLMRMSGGKALGDYQVNFHFSPGILPVAGDTLFVRTRRPLAAADVFRFTADTAFSTGVEEREAIRGFALSQNYPNPFNPATEIVYQTSQMGYVRIIVYDLLGRVVARLVDRIVPAGEHHVWWNASTLPSGVYFYRMEAGGFMQVKKMVLTK